MFLSELNSVFFFKKSIFIFFWSYLFINFFFAYFGFEAQFPLPPLLQLPLPTRYPPPSPPSPSSIHNIHVWMGAGLPWDSSTHNTSSWASTKLHSPESRLEEVTQHGK